MNLTNKRIPNVRSHSGFSLVEVLIALVVMSIGMLGIAGLYVESMQAGRTSSFRHNAVTIASDIADRIRANPTAGAFYQGVRGNNNCVLGNVNCNPEEMAYNDIDLWLSQAEDTLPNGSVVITFDDTVEPSTYEIEVSWDEAGVSPSPTFVIEIPVIGT